MMSETGEKDKGNIRVVGDGSVIPSQNVYNGNSKVRTRDVFQMEIDGR